MNVLVIGGGIIGLSSAYALARSGHTVTVLERNRTTMSATSLGNAGLLRTSSWASLATPHTIRMGLQSFTSPTPYLIVRPLEFLGAHGAAWAARFVWHALVEPSRRRAERDAFLRAFAVASRDAMTDWAAELGVPLQSGGLTLLASSAAAESDRAAAAAAGEPCEPAACPPGWPRALTAALEYPHDRFGDCVAFGRALERHVRVRTGWDAASLEYARDGRVVAVRAADGRREPCDHVVMCTGHDAALLAPPGDAVWPLWGYSLDFRRPDSWPESRPFVFDKMAMIVATPLPGARVRLTGFAELAGRHAPSLEGSAPLASLRQYGARLGLGDPVSPGWVGGRPTTPDGVPIIGRDPSIPNLSWNVGHGAMGFRTAAASAEHLVRCISHSPIRPDFDRFLSPARFATSARPKS